MAKSDITAINAKTISVNGVPIPGSGTPAGQWTTFDQMDADVVLALNGTVIRGVFGPGMIFTNYDNVNVLSGVGLGDVVQFGMASTPATNAATGPINSAGAGAPLPQLTLTGPLAFTVAAASGTLIANIGNVPTGATPTVVPNDGRFAIAGDAGAGWKVVVGLSASSAGTVNITVNAAGALPVSAPVVVSAASAFVPAIARPTATAGVIPVSTTMSSAAIASAYAGATPGQAIEFDDGTYDQPACFPNGYNRPGVIIRAKNRGAYDADPLGDGGTPHWARFVRRVIFEYHNGLGGTTGTINAADVTIHDLHHTTRAGFWPADNSRWTSVGAAIDVVPAMITLGAGAHRHALLYNEFSVGYGPSKAVYDPSQKLIDMNSPATFAIAANGEISSPGTFTGWGDATYLTYNRILNGPCGVRGNSYAGDSGTHYGNYAHDMGSAWRAVFAGSGNFLFQHNWLDRVYQDYGNFSTGSTTAPTTSRFDQNVWQYPFSDSKDSGNPHPDTNQVYWAMAGGGTLMVRGLSSARNYAYHGPTDRGAMQVNFFQMAGGHSTGGTPNIVSGLGTKIRENLILCGGSAHVADLGCVEDGYVRGNLAFHAPGQANPAVQCAPFGYASENATVTRSSKTLLADNIYEQDFQIVSGATPLTVDKLNTFFMGLRGARASGVSESDVFVDPFATYPTTPAQAFNATKRKGGFVSTGPSPASIGDFLLAAADWTGERAWAGFVDALDQIPAAQAVSNPAWVHGGDAGDVLAFTPPAGVEWRTLSIADRTTQVKAWSSVAGTVIVDGEYLQLRATAPAQGATTNYTGTLGGQPVTWRVASASTAVYPAVVNNGTGRYQRSGTAALGADSSFMTLALRWKSPAANPGTNRTIFGDTGGLGPVRVVHLTTGALRITIANAAGTIIGIINCNVPMNNSGAYEVLLGVDVSQAASGDGVTLLVNGANALGSVTSWAGGAGVTLGWSRTGLTYNYMGVSTTYATANEDSYFYLNIAARVNLADGPTVAKFNADKIGTNGQNPSGTQPTIFLVGNATQRMAGTMQFGSGAAWGPIAGYTVTDVTPGQAAWGA